MSARDRTEDAHTALLESNLGQVVVAGIVFVMAIWIVGPNIPASPFRDNADVIWEPAVTAGFDQSWSVFSPNPRNQDIEVIAVLEYEDGTTATWSLPDFDPVVGVLRGYRWLKWQERIRLNSFESHWDSAATWIADSNRQNGELPVTVRLVRRWTVLSPLTADGVNPLVDGQYVPNTQNEFEFYVWTNQ